MTRLPVLLATTAACLALTACGSSSSPESEGEGGGGSVAAQGPADAQTATIVGNARLQFVPAEVTMQPGTLRLTMENEGGVPHDLEFTGDGADAGERIPATSETATGTYVFDEAGTYDFVCTLHPGMEGRVVVASP